LLLTNFEVKNFTAFNQRSSIGLHTISEDTQSVDNHSVTFINLAVLDS